MTSLQEKSMKHRSTNITCPACKQKQWTIVQYQPAEKLTARLPKLLRRKSSIPLRLDHFCSQCYVRLGHWIPSMLFFSRPGYLTEKSENARNLSRPSWDRKPSVPAIQLSPLGPFPRPTGSSPHIELIAPLYHFALCFEEQEDTILVTTPDNTHPRQTSGPTYNLFGSIKTIILSRELNKHNLTLWRTDEPGRSRCVGDICSTFVDWCLNVRASTADRSSEWSVEPSMPCFATEQGWLDWDDHDLIDVYGRTCASYEQTWKDDKKIYIKYAPTLELMPTSLDQVLLIVLAKAIINIRTYSSRRQSIEDYKEPRNYRSSVEVLGLSRVAILESEMAAAFEKRKTAFFEDEKMKKIVRDKKAEEKARAAQDTLAGVGNPLISKFYSGMPRSAPKKRKPGWSGAGGWDGNGADGWDGGTGTIDDAGGNSPLDLGVSSGADGGGGDSGGGGGGGGGAGDF